jgi:hypothetical protein
MREIEQAFEALNAFGPILSIKLYRLKLDPLPAVPIIPCLDHEAMLHQHVAPHAAAYLQERATGELHELTLIPDERRIEIDTVSTWEEHSAESRQRLLAMLQERLPGYRVAVKGPSGWRGEQRVAEACRAQVPLRAVLLDEDIDRVKAAVDRLQTVGTLMEKESRVASWGVRTVTGPVLAAAGVLSFLALGSLEVLGAGGVTALRYLMVGLLGAVFLYYGLKAVQLTGMANRVWKRSAEYALILSERKRLRAGR